MDERSMDEDVVNAERRPKKRRTFTNGDRLRLVRVIRRNIGEGHSIRGACEAAGVHPKQYREWSKKLPSIASAKRKGMTLNKGPKSCWHEHEEALLEWFFEMTSQGLPMSIQILAIKASKLSPAFRAKPSRLAKYKSARRFIKRNKLTHRMGTHESQRAPAETQEEALDWIQLIRPMVVAISLAEPSLGWTVAVIRVNICDLCNTALETTTVFQEMLREKSHATSIDAISDPKGCNGSLFLSINLNLYSSKSNNHV